MSPEFVDDFLVNHWANVTVDDRPILPNEDQRRGVVDFEVLGKPNVHREGRGYGAVFLALVDLCVPFLQLRLTTIVGIG